jgi:hypothetical protein
MASTSRIPDYGVEIFVILAAGTAEIGVELLGPEGWIGQAQRDVVFARGFALFAPSRANFSASGIHPMVGLDAAALGGIEQDIDRGNERKRPQLTFEIAIFLLGYKSD